ncbi:hypothetical protein BGZ67_004844 [Mortierella alpina]|nr:hypothetical protein BGZ67_004844 [Mortierella alpina]
MYSRPGPIGLFQTVSSFGHANANRTRSETPTSLSGGPKSPLLGALCNPERPFVVQRAETSDPRYKKPITITVSSLIQMAQYCSKLELLCLGSTILTPDTLFLETGDYQSTLQPGPRAGLTFVPVVIADVAKALGQYCPRLQTLWLPGCEWVTLDELRVFLTHCRRLEVLDLRHCGKLDGRLSQLFVLKNTGGVAQEGRSTQPSESEDDSDEDSNTKRHRTMSWAMSRTGIDCVGAPPRQDTVKQIPISKHRMHAPVLVQNDPGSERTGTREGAMFDVVNAASSGRLGTFPGPDPPPLWPQAEHQQQPPSAQESPQVIAWEERLQLHFLQQRFLQQQQEQMQRQSEPQPLVCPPQMQLQQNAPPSVITDPFSLRLAASRYRSADGRGSCALLQEQHQKLQRQPQQQQQQEQLQQYFALQHALRSPVAPDSINRYQLADDHCALELLRSLDHPRNEVEAHCDPEHALQSQGGSSGCDSENSSATDDDDNDDEYDQSAR